jgi:hypothetical protein
MVWFTRIERVGILEGRGVKENELGAFHGVPKPAIISGEYDREDLGVILFFGCVSSVYPMSVAILHILFRFCQFQNIYKILIRTTFCCLVCLFLLNRSPYAQPPLPHQTSKSTHSHAQISPV